MVVFQLEMEVEEILKLDMLSCDLWPVIAVCILVIDDFQVWIFACINGFLYYHGDERDIKFLTLFCCDVYSISVKKLLILLQRRI